MIRKAKYTHVISSDKELVTSMITPLKSWSLSVSVSSNMIWVMEKQKFKTRSSFVLPATFLITWVFEPSSTEKIYINYMYNTSVPPSLYNSKRVI